jgi:outer membrane receptor for ferrienterochelin and colicins
MVTNTKGPMSNLGRGRCTLVLLLLLAASSRAAAQAPLPDLSLEELMAMDAGRVFGASVRLQPVTEAPASVSFITAEEIARYGYRTLADILRGVRGMYVTNDRNFSFLGTRGFGRPGDYNSRILLLVNGHRVNDNVVGQAEIGAEFGMDPALFERVEIIRGPASSLYGDSAFFAVVNVITRSGASLDGVSLSVDAGTLDTQLARVSAGRRFADGLDVAAAATYEHSAGVDQLFFPAFDTPATNHGIAVGLDGERSTQLYGQLSYKNFVFTGAYGRRQKDVPTASFGTLFNEHQPPEQTTDRHALAVAEYSRTVGAYHVTVRGSFDQFSYDGIYPTLGDSPGPALVAVNSGRGSSWTAEARLTRALPRRQFLTVGGEFIDNVHQDQRLAYDEPIGEVFAIHHSSVQHAVYVQDEIKLTSWLIANGGLRYDAYEVFQRVTPRAALIAIPSPNQSFKYLFGQAFRAPNQYEQNFFNFGEATLNLRPESISTHELVWERYLNDWLRTSVSAYWYNATDLITLVPDSSALLGTTYVNGQEVHAKGLELEAQMRLGAGLQGLVSYALQRAHDIETGAALINSPEQMVKLRVSVPGPSKRSFVSGEVLSMSSRQTRAGNILKPTATANVTITAPIGPALLLVGSARNVFNAQYGDPVSDLNLQDSIVQNGRTLRIGLTWKFLSK